MLKHIDGRKLDTATAMKIAGSQTSDLYYTRSGAFFLHVRAYGHEDIVLIDRDAAEQYCRQNAPSVVLPTKTPNAEGTQRISLHLSREAYAKVTGIAEKNNWSITATIEWLIMHA